MTVDSDNPYASSFDHTGHDDPYIAQHDWRGHAVTVEGGLLASRLWMISGYTIEFDGKQRFVTAQLSATENFTFKFDHQGRKHTGHFETFGINNGIVRKYELWLDGESLGKFKLKLRGWWIPYLIGVVVGLVIAALLAISSLPLHK